MPVALVSGVRLAGDEAEDDRLAAEFRRQRVPLTRLKPHVRAVVSIAAALANSLHQRDNERPARRLFGRAAQTNTQRVGLSDRASGSPIKNMDADMCLRL